jgi:hypothetical protein
MTLFGNRCETNSQTRKPATSHGPDSILGIDAKQTRKPANPQPWTSLSRLPICVFWLSRRLHASQRWPDSILGIDAKQTRKPANPQPHHGPDSILGIDAKQTRKPANPQPVTGLIQLANRKSAWNAANFHTSSRVFNIAKVRGNCRKFVG